MSTHRSRLAKYLLWRDGPPLLAWVDPHSILYPKHSHEWPGYLRYWPSLTCPGNWDRYDSLHPAFREEELRSLLLDETDYTASSRYQRLCAQLESDGRTRFPRCHSTAEIHAYFKNLYALRDSMRRDGYRPSQVSGAEGDIDIRIDRSGQLLKCGQGTHRLAVARILRLPFVLVRIDLIHSRWLDSCVDRYQRPPREALREWLRAAAPQGSPAVLA